MPKLSRRTARPCRDVYKRQLFNLINVILAALVIITGAWKNLTFLGIVFLNTGIGVVQALRSKRMVDKLTLLASKKATALRDGALVELDLDQIVLDDVIRLGRGDQIPADAVVVEGECHVNESLLTGESNPIHKRSGDELMSGSFIDAGLVVARVIHVGADNYVARINNEAKYVKKVNSEIMNALNAIVRFASVFMVPIGIALFCASANSAYRAWCALDPNSFSTIMGWLTSGESWSAISAAILSTVGALLGMIPQGLVLLTSSVLAIATIRLARRKVLAQQLYCIETLARVDVLCLDKTGTITSGRMEVEGTYLAESDGSVVACSREDGAKLPAGASPDAERIAALDCALSGIARATSADANETCTAILARYADETAVPRAVRTVAFSSAKKWSGATLVVGDQELSYVMGAAQFVLASGDFSRFEPAAVSYTHLGFAAIERAAGECAQQPVFEALGHGVDLVASLDEGDAGAERGEASNGRVDVRARGVAGNARDAVGEGGGDDDPVRHRLRGDGGDGAGERFGVDSGEHPSSLVLRLRVV